MKRQIETFSYTDRQVNRMIAVSISIGVVLGIILAYVFHIPSLR